MLEASDQSISIARIAGPYLLVSALGFVASRQYYEQMITDTASAHPVLVNLSGAVHFVIGMVILTQHFDWSGIVQFSVTMLGVAAVAKGFVLIAFPKSTVRASGDAMVSLNLSAIGFFIAGTWYCFVGFGSFFL
ncbi:hypothetical protein GCM10009096_01700 [Parasphingorhabdus litoris]|uniref:Uncharacterized protein n=1 Tax=Parasphingorhabdus litoris TaxID=394733 RepID=A0ABN1A0V1_9SPHN|nr:hypothetical protein [Parasphingorhabdus litoris]